MNEKQDAIDTARRALGLPCKRRVRVTICTTTGNKTTIERKVV